ncbi:PREDICTED: cyclin-T1-3-like [Lupinus angustifolius]|nr:PREDICTED: cyclin-T1-3-like [Lupinus angustifolius]
MAGLLLGDISHNGTYQGGTQIYAEETPEDGPGWYFSKKEIEENSPSKLDGVDLKKEAYLRKSYCTFLQDLGMRLKVPQVTIATAIIFCHRFFLRQSHARNDRRIIATVCMFLAGKVEETPRPLKDVILVSYEIINKKDPSAAQRIKQKEVYEQQKEIILLGERVVLATLGFDLNVNHPYKPLVEAIKKFKVAQNALAQVAWNFVNDGLRTSLCLQFKPYHIAAGAIFLAAKFLKVKLPSDGEKVWWQEFDVTPRQLEEVSNQMLELYEQNRIAPSNDVEGTAGSGNQTTAKVPASNDETTTTKSNPQIEGISSTLETSKPAAPKNSFVSSSANHVGRPVSNHGKNGDYESTETKHRIGDDDAKGKLGNQHSEQEPLLYKENIQEAHESNVGRSQMKEDAEMNDKQNSRSLNHRDGTFSRPQHEAIKKIDKDKLKAAIEKRKKATGHITKKTEIMDDDDLIERELEDGIELAAQNDKSKHDRRQSWSGKYEDHGEDHVHRMKVPPSFETDTSAVEEGEVAAVDEVGPGYQSPKSSNHKRKAGSSPDRIVEGKRWHTNGSGPPHHGRYVQESHV